MTLFFRCFINPDSRYRWIRNDARLYKLPRGADLPGRRYQREGLD